MGFGKITEIALRCFMKISNNKINFETIKTSLRGNVSKLMGDCYCRCSIINYRMFSSIRITFHGQNLRQIEHLKNEKVKRKRKSKRNIQD